MIDLKSVVKEKENKDRICCKRAQSGALKIALPKLGKKPYSFLGLKHKTPSIRMRFNYE
jgi:hypothetical protein